MTATVGKLLAASGLPMLEARALLAHCLGVARERLVAHPELAVDAAAAAAFHAAVGRRMAGEPLAYLLGEREFYGRPFAVGPDVLVPRPETELLVELGLVCLHAAVRPRVLDLGTGSGCLAITLALERPDAHVVATDASTAALAVARANAVRLGARVEFLHGDWYDALRPATTFDAIVANPPYVAADDPHLHALRFEPRAALTDGGDGLACLATVVAQAARHLAGGGWLLVEHGHDQAAAVQAMFCAAGFAPALHRDAAGQPRVTAGRWGGPI